MKHGEVHSPAEGSTKFVVLSTDAWNVIEGAEPVIAHLIRRRGLDSEFLVETGEMDPVTGTVMLPWPETVPADMATVRHGLLTGSTMAQVQHAMRLLYGL